MHKLLVGAVGLVAFMVILVPGIVIFLMGGAGENGELAAVKSESLMIHVYLHERDKIETMALEEYIKGVLGAEMPAQFEMEALKAQAVAARTYAVKNMRSFGGAGVGGQPDADLSTDPAKNQAWLGSAALKERWGSKYDSYWNKIGKAVESTRGQIAVYEDQPISAVFHSTSADRTASAKEVWGGDVPYLQSVACTWDQAAPRYKDHKTVAVADLPALLGADAVTAAAQAAPAEFAKVLSLTDSGRVQEIRIGGKTLSGQEARALLGLRSDNFTVRKEGEQLVFDTLGYGHGVGLCQYGANGMAKIGRQYQEILQHYYTGVTLKDIYGS